MKHRVAITTLGCKANQYDSAVLSAACQQAGWHVVPFNAEADAYIVNTCTVTASADAQSRQLLRRAGRRNRDALLIATGCYAQVAPEELAAIDGVAHVIGTEHRRDIVHLLYKEWGGVLPGGEGELVAPSHRVRPFLKIQDGCDLRCTYCIIPKARGAQRSWPMADVLAHLEAYRDAGYDEVVLTGIHLGTYGRDLDPPCSFTDLLRVIVRRRPIARVRISSIDPNEVTDEMVELLQDDRVICPHLHLPIQSGSDQVLKRMARLYRRRLVDAVLNKLATRLPHLAIGTDLIVGFPGESEADFQASYDLLAQAPISYAHIFPYSGRKGTPALRLPDACPKPVIEDRAARLRALSDARRMAYYRSHLGETTVAIPEGRRDRRTGKIRAMMPHYVPVLIDEPRGKMHEPRYRPVRILEVTGHEVYAQWI